MHSHMASRRERRPRPHYYVVLGPGGRVLFWPMRPKELLFLLWGVALLTYVSLRGGGALAVAMFPAPTPLRLCVIAGVFAAGALLFRRFIPADIPARWDTYERDLLDLEDYERRWRQTHEAAR